MNVSEKLQGILDNIPVETGCYLMKDAEGKVIYIGKAVNLRSRVRSYFHRSAQADRKTARLAASIADIEWIVVDSELEALILEMNLIKQHRPRYNVRLKDDKRYPYIKVHWADPFPKVTVTRKMVQDGSRYFGPYTSVWAVHKTLDVLRKVFPYLTCDREITGKDERACLYYDIKLCNAPCIGKVDRDIYRMMIADLCNFLNGRTEEIVGRMKLDMESASAKFEYEKAGSIRDQLLAIENIVERQKVVSNDYIDSDVIAMARSDREACVQVFFIRSGKLIGREYFMMENTEGSEDSAVMTEFLKQFYDQAANVPSQVLLPQEVEEARVISEWLRKRRDGKKVEIKIPRRGKKKELINMASKNALETLNSLQAQWEADRHRHTEALSELQKALKLEQVPNRIECYDISNTQGTAAVGSMVVFEQGVPNKKLYRRFNIKSVTGPDDFASMVEVLERRFNRWESSLEPNNKPGKKTDRAFSQLPDLVIVDGGKGQLSRSAEVFDQYNLNEKVLLVALAKQSEEIFVNGKAKSVFLKRKSQGLYLVQRIRDEAHRFAITSHRKKRSKLGLASQLDAVPGIGPAKRKALLTSFGSIDKIRKASAHELSRIKGISAVNAENLKNHLA
jgi:excinuclease ABC subunit C